MTGIYNRPLGIKDTKENAAATRRPIFVGLLIAIVCISAVVFWYLDMSSQRFGSKEEQFTHNISVVDKNVLSPIKKVKPRPDLPIDLDGPAIVELAPGKITGAIPTKRPVLKRQEKGLSHLPDRELVEQSAYGLLPKISNDGLKPFDFYSRQPETEGNFGVARMVIIIGGLGISQTTTQQAIAKMPPEVTLAFAPFGNSLKRWMQSARKKGHELLLQLPMEPFGYPNNSPGKQVLLTSVEQTQNQDNLHWLLGRITNYVGVINFLGGKMLTDTKSLEPILSEISERGLMFVDDGSIKNSQAQSISTKIGLPFAKATMKLDANRSKSAIIKNLEIMEKQAKRTGLAIGFASAFPDSIKTISNYLTKAKNRGIEITPISSIASINRE